MNDNYSNRTNQDGRNNYDNRFNHVKYTRDEVDTADEFVSKVNEVLAELNTAWVDVKTRLPADQQAEGETKVRAVLKAA